MREKCTWTWATLCGVNGSFATGPNGNTIFLPAAGFFVTDSPYAEGSWGRPCSRTLSPETPYMIYDLNIQSGRVFWGACRRDVGFTVRAVRVSQN